MAVQNSLNQFSDQFVVPDSVTIGQDTLVPSIPFGGGTLDVKLLIDTEGGSDLGGVVENRHTDIPALGANLILSRTRGTHAAPTVVQSGDDIGRFIYAGFDGTEFVPTAEIEAVASGTVAAGKVPGSLTFSTADDATGAMQLAATISNAQVLTLANALPIGSGGTGLTATASNGQLLIGNGSGYTLAALTAGDNIVVTNGAGSISVAATPGAITWSSITSNQSAISGEGYFVTANAVQVALPASAAVGATFKLVLAGGTSWEITQGAGQQIFFGNQSTTSGAGGSLTSTAQGDTLELVCRVADDEWQVVSAIGNITVV
jgi:hypothetical protein